MEFFFTLILTWIIVFLMTRKYKTSYKYKEKTPEEIERDLKEMAENAQRNLEKWERLKAEADAEAARLKAQKEIHNRGVCNGTSLFFCRFICHFLLITLCHIKKI